MQSANYIDAESPYTYVALVTPMTGDPATSGKIRHLPCAPTVKHACLRNYEVSVRRGDEYVSEISYSVEPAYQKAGYVLLGDLFEAEGMLEEWKQYQQLLRDLALGRKVKPFPEDKLPKEVRRRRACGAEADAPAQAKGRVRG